MKLFTDFSGPHTVNTNINESQRAYYPAERCGIKQQLFHVCYSPALGEE